MDSPRLRRLMVLLLLAAPAVASAEVPVYPAEIIGRFTVPEARQGVAVDGEFFYAINNTNITKHDKAGGQVVMGWRSGGETISHLDSGVILEGRLYAAHSNYPESPMANSVEIRQTNNLSPVASRVIDASLGSLTWIDRHNGAWWGTFAGYDIVPPGQAAPYGGTANTRIARMAEDFRVEASWSLPDDLLTRMRPMSNSGGSWGPDGYLYLTGHDHPEIYVMAVPDSGSELVWLATVIVEGFDGQGIAWDRSGPDRELWGIVRDTNTVLRIRMPVIGP